MSANGTPPDFPVGKPAAYAWREHAQTQIGELADLKAWVVSQLQAAGVPDAEASLEPVDRDLRVAYSAVSERPGGRVGLLSGWTGARVERAMSHLDAARATLLRLAPLAYVRSQVPVVLAQVRAHLQSSDPQRQKVEAMAKRPPGSAFADVDRYALVSAYRAATEEGRAEITRVRSFRNLLFSVAGVVVLAAAGLVVFGAANPSLVHLCFNPEDTIVCPTSQGPVSSTGDNPPTPDQLTAAIKATASSWDLLVVALVGLLGAGVTAAVGLKNVRGTSGPYSLPVALAVLKLPTGALTAILGLLLMRGEFVPGLSALDSSGQILAWGIVFGSAQQLVLGLVDQQAQVVLDQVGDQDEKDAKMVAAGGAPDGGTSPATG